MTVHTEIVAGGETDFLAVRALTASGSEREIGRALAERARQGFGWTPAPADPVKARARNAWFARYWPQHLERIRGVAQALDLDAEQVYLDCLSGLPTGSACSATYYPPASTADGRPVFGRNYDFFTTSATDLFAMLVGEPASGGSEPPLASRPHVLVSHPDDGPATVVLTMNDLDGCMEGINEHGLAVALLIADAESASAPAHAGPQVGLNPVQLPRFLLDTCATAAQALDALYAAKQYDMGPALHYLVGDRHGDAFVWERGPGGAEYAVRADAAALCVTNHPLHRPTDAVDNPETLLTHHRYRTVAQRSAGTGLSATSLRDALDAARVDARSDTRYPVRTLWRTVFDLDRATMATRFYLGDEPDGGARYSPELEFAAVSPERVPRR